MSNPTRNVVEPTTLLPCPFCGGKAEFRSGSSTTPYIRCKECGGRTKSSRNKAKLIAAWNMRADGPQPTHHVEAVDYLCDMCSNGCDERRVIRVGQGAYDVCERWKEVDHD